MKIFFAFSFFALSIISPLHSCSRVFWNSNPVAKLAARTMDLNQDEKPQIKILPKGMLKNGQVKENSLTWTSKYRSVIITAFETAVSDGMNEKGLAAHLLYLDGTEYEERDSRPGLSNTKWIEFVLDNYSNVKEVIDGNNGYQIVSSEIANQHWPLHLVIEDVSGDSAIFEYIDGKMHVHHGKEITVATNDPSYDVQIANLKKYAPFGGNLTIPCGLDSLSRFARLSAYLKTIPEPKNQSEATAYILGIIHTVQIPFGAKSESESLAWPTRWITVADLTNQLYYFISATKVDVVIIDLNKLF